MNFEEARKLLCDPGASGIRCNNSLKKFHEAMSVVQAESFKVPPAPIRQTVAVVRAPKRAPVVVHRRRSLAPVVYAVLITAVTTGSIAWIITR